jgi:hypothetical protein
MFSLRLDSYQPTSSAAGTSVVSKSTPAPHKVPAKPQNQPQPKPGMSRLTDNTDLYWNHASDVISDVMSSTGLPNPNFKSQGF